MKKFLLTLLIVMISLVGMCACQDSPQTSESTPPDSTSESTGGTDRGDPEFPDNAFDKDNEVTYPDAWN